jgi:glycogen debranching enzyme
VRGKRRPARGKRVVQVLEPDAVAFVYEGLDGRIRRTTLRFDPAPALLDENLARFELNLAPGERMSLFLTIYLGDMPNEPSPAHCFFPRLRGARRALRRSTAGAASVITSNDIFNEVLCRSMSDLYMLMTDTPWGPYPYAGIPWFSTAFGRDGIITAMQMLWIDPAIARGVLGFLSANQAIKHDPGADAQPGKILHEIRKGEMAELGEVPFGRYYGSVDSTPLFAMLAGMYLEQTGDVETVRRLWPNIEAALGWIDNYGDYDGDGFVEYKSESETGLVNQGWKDSVDSVFHADGTLARGAIALCEVQGYVWAAKVGAARIAKTLGMAERASVLERQAAELRQRFEDTFWCEGMSSYALALDGAKKKCAVLTSNVGQVLFSGIARPDRAAKIADRLLGPDFFSGWGIRTVARTEPRYNAMSYHNGSIWPHDNALIALGLRRYGLLDHVQRLFAGLFDAASYMELRRLPELFCGFRRTVGRGPTYYPVACAPQAWASAAPFALLQACLGLDFDPAGGTVRFRNPRLPIFLNTVEIKGLAVPSGHIDVALRRYGQDVSVNVLRRDGKAGVAVSL